MSAHSIWRRRVSSVVVGGVDIVVLAFVVRLRRRRPGPRGPRVRLEDGAVGRLVGVDEVPGHPLRPVWVVGGDRLRVAQLDGERPVVTGGCGCPASWRRCSGRRRCPAPGRRRRGSSRRPTSRRCWADPGTCLATIVPYVWHCSIDRGSKDLPDGPAVDRVEEDRDAVRGGQPQVASDPLPVRRRPGRDVPVHERDAARRRWRRRRTVHRCLCPDQGDDRGVESVRRRGCRKYSSAWAGDRSVISDHGESPCTSSGWPYWSTKYRPSALTGRTKRGSTRARALGCERSASATARRRRWSARRGS